VDPKGKLRVSAHRTALYNLILKSKRQKMSFEKLNLMAPLQRALDKEGYTSPTPIQMEAIPYLLKGKDLMGIAQTGTGKTAAFVLPILQRMSEVRKSPIPGTPRVLVLAPTRELAAQIDQSFATYGQFLRFRHTAVFGGVKQGMQVRDLSRGVDILVATPGRLMDLMKQGHIRLKGVEFFVLDEIDRMLDMGFINDVKKIVAALPGKRQSLFFSATMSKQTGELAGTLLTDPVLVETAPQANALETTEQRIFFVDHTDKFQLLLGLLEQRDMTRTLIFTRTKHGADKLAMMLGRNEIDADAIHGNKSQGQRTTAMRKFKSGHLQVLVATDIAARGIDVDGISHVVNYDLPNEPENYVHRIGRTGRAGAKGTAYSFCSADERNYLRSIERLTQTRIEMAEHKYHSERAKNATGAAAEPTPKRSFQNHRPRVVQRSSRQESPRKPSGPRKSYSPRRN
jgi:ATP-dependent RNA helicase RhlE